MTPNDHEETPVVTQLTAVSSSQIVPNRSISKEVHSKLKDTKNVPAKTEPWHSRSTLMLRLAKGNSQTKSMKSTTSHFKQPKTPHLPHKADKDVSEPVSSHVQTQRLLPCMSRLTIPKVKKQLVVREIKLN